MSYYIDIALSLEKKVIETKQKHDVFLQQNNQSEIKQCAIDNEDFYQRWLKQASQEAETMPYLKANLTKAIKYMREYRVIESDSQGVDVFAS